MICCKIHVQGSERILAAADQSALGKMHIDAPAAGEGRMGAAAGRPARPRRVLDLIRFRSFYEGETTDEAGLARLLAGCSSSNLVGEKAVGVAVRMGLAQPPQIIQIGAVPHLQLYRISPSSGKDI